MKGRVMDSLFVSKNIAPLIAIICGGLCWIMSVYFMYLKKKTVSTTSDSEQTQETSTSPVKPDDIIPPLIDKGLIIIIALCILGMNYYLYLKGYFTTEIGLLTIPPLLFLIFLWMLADGKISLPGDEV
jgi:hypothetical protein